MKLPELAVHRPVAIAMFLSSLVLLGGVALSRLPLAYMPEVEEPELFVRLPYRNAAPEQVERMVVRPVEEALSSVRGLKKLWSRSDQDGGMVRLEFDWSADLNLVRVEVWEKIDRIRRELPDDMEDITVGTSWNNRESDAPILEGRLSSSRDLSESYDILERKIVRPLLRVPGVAQVRLDGVVPREVHINLRLKDLEAHNVSVTEVRRVLEGSNFDQSLGKITEGERRYAVRTLGSFRTVEEIAGLVLRRDGLRLADVADVAYEEPELEFGRHLDGHFAIGITVSAESSANVVDVCRALEEKLGTMQEDPELEGLKFLIWMNQGQEIENTLGELFFSGMTGAVLAAIVLYVFLRRLSTTLLSVLSIPFSLVITCGFIWAKGGTLNTLSLLGLIVGVGMLVDNAVVVIENIYRHQELGYDRKQAARLGAREVSTAVIAATLTSAIVFLPLVFNKPSEMTIPMREIGVTICVTLLASLFVSQTLIPLATSWCIRARARPRERWIVWLEERYARLLRWNLRHRWLTPLLCAGIFASTIYPFQNVDINFDRGRSEVYVQVRYEFSGNVTLEHKEDVVSRIEQAIEPHREELLAKSIYSWWSDGFTMTRVYLTDGSATPENLQKARDRLREVLPEIPGVRLEVGEHHRSWRRNSGKRIAFQVLGDDPRILAELAEAGRERLAAVPGLAEASADVQDRQHELHVELDRSLMARYELSADLVGETVGLTFRGRRLARFRTPSGEREMRLTLEEQETESVTQLRDLPLRNALGVQVPLASVASFGERRGAERVERDDRRTGIWVSATYDEGTREDYVPLVEKAIADMEFPPGYSWSFGDWAERRREKSREFLIDLLLALLLVFAVMAGLFESVSRALALLIALPFALSGAFWTLYLTGTDFDQPAAVGLLLLIGIVVNNGIVMLEHVGAYQRRGLSRSRAMLQGGKERLRPILMTALTTLLGLLPIIVERPSLGGTTYYSMALVIMGGLALSTFLTTVLLPTTSTLVEDGIAALARLLRLAGPRSREAGGSRELRGIRPAAPG